MADLQHTALTSASVHEPKHITNGTTGDAGKVITNDASTNFVSDYRLLDEAEVTGVLDVYTVPMAAIGTSKSVWFVAKHAGTITSVSSVIDGAIATADETISLKIGGVSVTNGFCFITQAGSAAGDVDTGTATGANTVATNGAVEIFSAGNSTGTVQAVMTVVIQRSSP